MSGERERKSFRVPKAGPPPPPARPPVPITEVEVLRWAKRIESLSRKSATTPDPDIPRATLLTLEHSIRRLLEPTFRAEFSDALFGEQQIAKRGYFASDPTRGRELLRKWGVIEIVTPGWNPRRRRYTVLAAFPVPIFHWRGRGAGESGGPEDQSFRLLMERAPMTWHPQYILRCRLCGWSQGGLGSSETFMSTIPLPKDQLGHVLGSRRFRRGELRRPYTIYRDLAEAFSEELWGFEAAFFASDKRQRGRRQPKSGKVADLLDEGMGYRETYGIRPDRDPHRMHLRSVGPRLKVLRWLLAQLRCQVCDRPDTLRFTPRILFPIDIDLTARSQSDLAYEVAEDLEAKRGLLRANPIMRGVFWIPAMVPHLRPAQIAERIHTLLEEAHTRRPPIRIDPRRAALWVVSRMSNRKGWDEFEAKVLDYSVLPVQEDDMANAQIGPLRASILSALGTKKPGQVVGDVWNILHYEAYACAGRLLLDHYRDRVLPHAPKKRRSKIRHRKALRS